MGKAKSFLVIGPANAGKTALLGCLGLATGRERKTNRNQKKPPNQRQNLPSFSIFAENEETLKLFQRAKETIRNGQLPFGSTTGITDYAFSMEMPHADPFWSFIARLTGEPNGKFQFNVPDARGGTVFPSGEENDPDKILERVIALARVASGLAICVDPTDENTSREVFLNLTTFLAKIGCRPLPWQRVVVVLTKADRHFLNCNRNAEMRALKVSPVEHGMRLMTKDAINSLRSFLSPSAKLGFCWTSCYGFEGGASNFDPDRNGLRVCGEPGPKIDEVIDSWEPFQVLDPFLFLATGQASGVKLLGDLADAGRNRGARPRSARPLARRR